MKKVSNSSGSDLQVDKARVAALLHQKRLAEALVLGKQICSKESENADNWFALANIHGQLGQLADAQAALDAGLQRRPDHLSGWFNKGTLHEMAGEAQQAERCYRKVLELQPDVAQAWFGLGNLQYHGGQVEAAEYSYREAIRYQPAMTSVQANLGKLLQAGRRFSEAARHLRSALQHCPGNADLLNDLGMALSVIGQTDEAEAVFRKALEVDPSFRVAISNLLLTLNYTSRHSTADVYREHVYRAGFMGEQVDETPVLANKPEPDRTLRIGLVSADFRQHSVASFIAPLLARHDRAVGELTCYADVNHPDDVTRQLQAIATHWYDISGMTDAQVVEQVRADEIDILVDLAGHTAGNRLPVFAARAAPVQVTWLGYPNTTGLAVMDYRLTDAWADPPGNTDDYYTEKLVRLPGCFICYQPPDDAPEPAGCPADDNGFVTYGSFNNYVKITRDVVACWAAVLQAVPGSRLVLKNFSLSDPEVRTACLERFREFEIPAERLVLHGAITSRREHLALYSQVDIGLDTFPYNGTTTTCESLWMGIPVITLAGDRHAGRVGRSLLSSLELTQLVADDQPGFVAIAVRLAADNMQRRQWRTGLRGIMQSSMLCDGHAFAREIESAWRDMWTHWCQHQARESRPG